MLGFIFSRKKHRVIPYVLIPLSLIFFLAQIPPVQAMFTDAACLAGMTAKVQHVKPHACCKDIAKRCGCDFKQGSSSKLPETDLVSSSGLPNSVCKDMVLSTDTTTSLLAGRKASVKNEMLTHGPPVSIYLQTLNLLC